MSKKLQHSDRKFAQWKTSFDLVFDDLTTFESSQLDPLREVRNDEIQEEKGSVSQLALLLPRTKQYQSMSDLLVAACKLEKRSLNNAEELN